MNRLFYALLLTALLTSTSTNTLADVVHQLAGVDAAGNTVVIEYTKSKHWEVVFEGLLGHCSVEVSDQSNRSIPNTFHQPLGNGQFAFACSNGYVYIAENGKPVKSVQLPTHFWRWTDGIKPYLRVGSFVIAGDPDRVEDDGNNPFHFNIELNAWKESPVYTVFSKEFNDTFEKNWLFAAQKGYLFIIDLSARDLHFEENWHSYFSYSFLPMGVGQAQIDHTETMTGLDIHKDGQGTFHLLAALALSRKNVSEANLYLQTHPLVNGTPAKEWRDLPKDSETQKQQVPPEYASDKFKCDLNEFPSIKKLFLAPNICNWPIIVPDPPSPRELKGLTIQPQLDHYHSYITFERTPDNTDYTVRKRTNENAFSREDL